LPYASRGQAFSLPEASIPTVNSVARFRAGSRWRVPVSSSEQDWSIMHTSSVKHGSPPVDDDALHVGPELGAHKSTPVW
jgi:hypothetical protein